MPSGSRWPAFWSSCWPSLPPSTSPPAPGRTGRKERSPHPLPPASAGPREPPVPPRLPPDPREGVDERSPAAVPAGRGVALLLPLQRRPSGGKRHRVVSRHQHRPGALEGRGRGHRRSSRTAWATSKRQRRGGPRQYGRLRQGRRHRRPDPAGQGRPAAVTVLLHGQGLYFQGLCGNPVMDNPGQRNWRDPKIIRDDANRQWVMALAEGKKSASTPRRTSRTGGTPQASNAKGWACSSARICSSWISTVIPPNARGSWQPAPTAAKRAGPPAWPTGPESGTGPVHPGRRDTSVARRRIGLLRRRDLG